LALSELIIKKIKPCDKAYKLSDGRGLFLLVKPNDSKLWRWKYRYGGKEKVLAFGVYPDVSLKDARESQAAALLKLSSGIDPAEERRIEKLKRHVSAEDTFEPIAREWLDQRREIWSASHARNILHRLENDVFPKIGKRPVREITAIELLAVLRSIESRGALDIAHRARSYCGQVFRYAISTGRAERDIAADLRGALKLRNPKSHARLEERELPEFLKKLGHYDGDEQTKSALLLLIHTFVRTVEVRGAKWDEFDFEKEIWTIPAERMKMRQKHIVPLSHQALEILRKQRLISHNREHVFPNRNKPLSFISENTLLFAIYRMGYHSRATSHGFRATASTILNENGFDADAIERQLAHGERNKVRAAYNYAEYLSERRAMMSWWSNYLNAARLHSK
jgi:integrase